MDPSQGPSLLARARRRYSQAEEEFDRSPETKAVLEGMFATAGQALAAGGHPDEVRAWLGLAEVRRYQKNRRTDTLAAFERALTADSGCGQAWDAYLDYVTYAARAEDLLEAVERMPSDLRMDRLPWLLLVAERRDRWGTMAPAEGARFLAELPGMLERLGDRRGLGLVLSDRGVREERTGSHLEALRLLRAARGTGYPTPAAVDRLTVRLVKGGQWAEAESALRQALAGSIRSDSMRERLERRLSRCRRQLGGPATASAPVRADYESTTSGGSALRGGAAGAHEFVDVEPPAVVLLVVVAGQNLALNTL